MNKNLKLVLVALCTSLLFVFIAFSGVLYSLDSSLSDKLYQQEKVLDGNIFIVGIDTKSLTELGPFQTWSRSYMAQAIENLNADPDNRPVAIGVDVMYFGYSDEEADEYLAEVSGEYGNVVMASMANFDSKVVVDEDGNFYLDDYAIDGFEEPYAELKENSIQGHINTMNDLDGIVRHAIHLIDLPDGRQSVSFDYQIYKLYAEANGLDLEVSPPMNSRYQWYIPYSAVSGGYYDNFSFSDLLTGELVGSDFSDSIVMIGPYASGLRDSYVAAIDNTEQMYGVEIHANIVDALIRGEFKEEVNDTIQYIVLFILVFVCSIFFFKKGILPNTIVWLLVTLGYVLTAVIMFTNGYVLHLLWIPLSITIIYTVSIVIHYTRATLEKRQVVNTFKRYVAPQIVDEIFKGGTDALVLSGKMTDVACLFVDIRGFTTMSEKLQPPEVVEILNKYLNLTTSCIMKNGGTLDKFVGDATMALFNAPLPQDDYIYKAVLTALDMIAGSEEVNSAIFEKFGVKVHFGVGVHCGKAVVGNIGAEMRMDYTAIGDTINTSARLESNAKAGQVLISRAVYDALEGRIKATSLGDTIRLKGKSEGFEVLVLDGLM